MPSTRTPPVSSLEPIGETKVAYRSRGGVEIGCYWAKNKWDPYFKLGLADDYAYLDLREKDFLTLLTILEQSKSLMN